jgi:hypothetical protein
MATCIINREREREREREILNRPVLCHSKKELGFYIYIYMNHSFS